ncbi:MAG TPA: MBL fold metallo-hydrolase [Thermohalobaculum sp.]|nr:MBL fold metallo-hydrolase [Thermohalobaculum sp.]
MGDRLRFTILGCGSSGGVPRIGAHGANWGACDPENPKNRRRRCALLVQRLGEHGRTSVLIDAGADVREQLIGAGCGYLDGLVLSHDHADHIHGIDDMRMVAFNRRARLPCWADAATGDTLMRRFGYIFETPEGSHYPPIMDLMPIDGPIRIGGAGGTVELIPFGVVHGEIMALGFRVGDVAYVPDVSAMTEEAWAACSGLDCWILDALRERPHVSHVNVDTALEWIERAAPRRAILTNMHTDLDHAALDARTPGNVVPAHDGLTLDYAL